jgi:hypothetical protein
MSASEIYPTDDAQAIGSMKPGDVARVFTPDDTHPVSHQSAVSLQILK